MFKYIETRMAHIREKRELSEALKNLLEEGSITPKFVLYSVVAAMIAVLGLLMNNVTILIGAMLIAPLLTPVISLSIGAGAGSIRLIAHSMKVLIIGLGLTFLSAAFITWLIQPESIINELYRSFNNGQLYALLAFLSGIVGVFNWLKPNNNSIIPGVAIAVALVPPTAFAGAALAINEQTVIIDVMQLIVINLGGLFLGGFLTFITFALLSKRPSMEVDKQVDSELEKKVKKK